MSAPRLGWSAALFLLAGMLDGVAAPAQTGPLRFHPVDPCRVVDTRLADRQPPALTSGVVRAFQIRQFATSCPGPPIPATARAVAYNATVVNPPTFGHLTIFPSDLASPPNTSSLNFAAGQTTANGGIVRLNTAATQDLKVVLVLSGGSGQAHFLLDVTGYFE